MWLAEHATCHTLNGDVFDGSQSGDIFDLDRFMLFAFGHCGGLYVTSSIVGDCCFMFVDSEWLRKRAVFGVDSSLNENDVEYVDSATRARR